MKLFECSHCHDTTNDPLMENNICHGCQRGVFR